MAPVGPPATRVSTRTAARCAYGAGIGGIVVSLLFIGFYTLEIQHPGDAPLGTASDVAGVTIGLLIPAALALGGYLPARRSARVIQAAGITAMAVAAIAGPLMVAGLLSFDVETPISAASVLVIFGWVALVSRMLAGSGAFRPRVTRFGWLLGKVVVAALALIAVGLPLPWMSRPQLIVAGVGAGIGAIAWLILPVWYLFLGQDLARAAPRRAGRTSCTASNTSGPADPPSRPGRPPSRPDRTCSGPAGHVPGRSHLLEGDSDAFTRPHA
jgi:hypothetical protein